MGFFDFLKRKSTVKNQKQLTSPELIVKCGLCESHYQFKHIFAHWKTHIEKKFDYQAHTGWQGAMRSLPEVLNRTAVFIVRRPGYKGEYLRFNLDEITAEYFSFVTLALRQEYPYMYFQYVPVSLGEASQHIKTLLIIGYWKEVVE